MPGYWLMVLVARHSAPPSVSFSGCSISLPKGHAFHFELSVAALGVSFILAWVDRVLFGPDPILMPHVSTSSVESSVSH